MRRLLNRSIVLAKLLLIAASLAAFSIPTAAMAAMVMFDFDQYATGMYGDYPNYSNGALVSNGFVLDPGQADWSPNAQNWIGHYHITDGVQDVYFDGYNGTKYFGFDYFLDDSRLNVYGGTGSVFGVRQLDLAEGLGAGSPSGTGVCAAPNLNGCLVTFVGILADGGGPIVRNVFLDGIHDGVGPLTDFETFTFGAEWDRLTMFSIISDHDYLNPGLDNLVLRTVPEPGSLVLLGLGLVGLALGRRSKQ